MVFTDQILVLKLLSDMRVIGGYLKGQKILIPLDKSTRPLKDRVRQSIFNIIEHSRNENLNLNGSKISICLLVQDHLVLNAYPRCRKCNIF